jgi:hypothetical protein
MCVYQRLRGRSLRVWIAASCGALAIVGFGGGSALASGSAPKLKLHVFADCTTRGIGVNIDGNGSSFRTWKRLKPTGHGATLRVNATTHPLKLDRQETSYSGHGGGFFTITFFEVPLSPPSLHNDANKRATVTWISSSGKHALHGRVSGGGHC